VDAGQLAQATASPIPIDRALERSAYGDSDAAFRPLARDRKGDHGAPAEKPLASDRRLEIAVPAEPITPFQGKAPLAGQPLATFAAPVPHHAHATPSAHAAQKAMDAAAVTFLGLEVRLMGWISLPDEVVGPDTPEDCRDRGSVPDSGLAKPDTACITS
jgi:hypothetical protein